MQHAAASRRDAGVVDQNIDAAKPAFNLGYCRLQGRPFCHIDLQRQRRHAKIRKLGKN
jgi:hypothetical protein